MEKKSGIHINAVDIAIIIILISAAIFAVYRYYPRSDGSDTRHITYCLQTEALSEEMTKKIAVGDKVFNFDDGSQIGIVSDISHRMPGTVAEDGAESETQADADGGQEFYITVSATAQIGNNGYLVNGTSISVGSKLKLRLPNLYCDAECILAAETDERANR